MIKIWSYFKVIFVVLSCSALVACAAIGTAVSHANLETQTLMSDTIFLSPEANQVKPTVFMMITNTTDKPDFKIKSLLMSDLKKINMREKVNKYKGYLIFIIKD